MCAHGNKSHHHKSWGFVWRGGWIGIRPKFKVGIGKPNLMESSVDPKSEQTTIESINNGCIARLFGYVLQRNSWRTTRVRVVSIINFVRARADPKIPEFGWISSRVLAWCILCPHSSRSDDFVTVSHHEVLPATYSV